MKIDRSFWNPKKISNSTLLFVFVLALTGGGCNEDPPATTPDRSRKLRITRTEPVTALVSDSVSRVLVEWDALTGSSTTPLWINLVPPGSQIPDVAPTINVSTSGAQWVTWHGRMYGAGYGTRTKPVPLGYQKIRATTYSDTSMHRAVTFVANRYDSDSDDFSNAVEDENAGIGGPVTVITYQGNTYYYSRTSNTSPPMISTSTPSSDSLYVNRGTHDYSLARGTVSAGRLSNGLRIANSGSGYYDKNAFVTIPNPNYIRDEHNWGILEIIRLIENVARQWNQRHSSGPRIGVGDISLQRGGNTLDHDQHENGLEVDVRYVRNNGTEGPVNTQNDPLYSQQLSQELINLFMNSGFSVFRIWVGDPQLQGSVVVYDATGVHNNHFHVWINDPDVSN